jgi:hypothetical protein
MVYSSMNTDNTDFSFFNIETAINGFVVKDDAAVAEVRLENELLIIINVLTIITNGNDELTNARRYDRCH